MASGNWYNIPLGPWPNPAANTQPPLQGIQPGPNVAPAAPQSFFSSLRRVKWTDAMQVILFIIAILTLILGLVTFGFTIPYTIFSNQKADQANRLASQANAFSNISLAYSDRAYCIEKKLEHTPGCKAAEGYILDHLGLADQVGLMLLDRAVKDGSDAQITYSAIEAVDFVRNSSYWMRCQLISFQDFKKDFGKLVSQMKTETTTSVEYASDFAVQADLVIKMFEHKIDDLKAHHDADSSQDTIDASSIVRVALQAMNATTSFHSLLISQAYQSASAATEDILERRPECEAEPDCRIETSSSLLERVTTSILNETSETLFVDYRRSRCPEPCRVGLWKANFLLQKWTDKTQHLLNKQPIPGQTVIAPSRQRRTWSSILEGPETKLAVLFGITTSFMLCTSSLEWVLISAIFTPAFLVMQRFILTSDPLEAKGTRFTSTTIDVLVPSVVTWAAIVAMYSGSTRNVALLLVSIVTAVFGALGAFALWPPEMLFGPLVYRPKTSLPLFDAIRTLKVISAFPVSYIITFEFLPLLEYRLQTLIWRRSGQFNHQKYVQAVFVFILGAISLYVSWMSLLLIVSVLYYMVLQIPLISGRGWWLLYAVFFAFFLVGFNMVYQEVMLDTVAYHGGCSAGEVYMEEYNGVVAMLGLSEYRGV